MCNHSHFCIFEDPWLKRSKKRKRKKDLEKSKVKKVKVKAVKKKKKKKKSKKGDGGEEGESDDDFSNIDKECDRALEEARKRAAVSLIRMYFCLFKF